MPLEEIASGSTRISAPLFKRAEETYGAGRGFVDVALIPRCSFIPCLPPTYLAQRRKTRASPDKGKHKAVETEPSDQYIARLKGHSITKAGITRDQEEIARLTYQATKGGKFFAREREKDAQHEQDVKAVLADLDAKIALRKGNLKNEEADVEHLLSQHEKQRDLSQYIVCVDADMFYASVEQLDDPSLIGKAYVVGGGIVLTASYEARKFGIRSAQGGNVAKMLLPDILFVEPHFERYYEKSREIMAVLQRYDANMAQASLDEAYLNLTPLVESTGKPISEILEELRYTMVCETGLTVSCGCGPNKMLAKIATDMNKPNGHFVVPADKDAILEFMCKLPVRKIPGIGRTTESWLSALDIKICADIWNQRGRLGLLRANLDDLLKAYLGISSNEVQNGQREDRLSCGKGWTFANTQDYDQVIVELRAIAHGLAEDLATSQVSGKTLSMSYKYDTFEIETHSYSSASYLRHFDELFTIGKRLFDKALADRRKEHAAGRPVKGSKGARVPYIRRISLRVSQLRDESQEAMMRRGEDVSGMLESWVKQDQKDDEKSSDRFVSTIEDALCPVCERKWSSIASKALNMHVDVCLRRHEHSQEGSSAGDVNRKRKAPDIFQQMMTRRKRQS